MTDHSWVLRKPTYCRCAQACECDLDWEATAKAEHLWRLNTQELYDREHKRVSALVEALENQRCAGCGIRCGGPSSGCTDCESTRAALQLAKEGT